MTTKNIQINSCDVVSNSTSINIDHYTIFPNSSSSFLNLSKPAEQIEIYKSTGQKLISKREVQGVDVSNLKSGDYNIVINNHKVYRIIKTISNIKKLLVCSMCS